MSDTFFSVIIPTYNRAALLERALKSLVIQTYKNFEVLVCDDGSTDNTEEVVNSFKNDLNLIYIKEENWGGPARPRNNGLKAAKGEWICYLDSDDSWLPEKLELVKTQTINFDIVYHDLFILDIQKSNKILKGAKFHRPIFDKLICENGVLTSGCCVRKNILDKTDGFTEDYNLIGVEDYDLWLKLSLITDKFNYVPIALGHYNDMGVNFHSNVYRMFKGRMQILKKYETLKSHKKAFEKTVLHYLPYLSIYYKKEALAIGFKITKLNPLWILSMILILIPKPIVLFFLRPVIRVFFKEYCYLLEE